MILRDLPILVTGFNRPKLLVNVLEQLENLEQQNVWFALDGPRVGNKSDQQLTKECFALISRSSLYSSQRSLIRPVNYGCKYGMADAITWFFQNNPRGVIIEDDLIFGKDFLQFCLVNLDKFHNNNAIGSITGYMPINIKIPQTSKINLNVSHPFFSAWGWASWADRWAKYDVELKNWRKKMSILQIIMHHGPNNPRYWIRRFNELEIGRAHV